MATTTTALNYDFNFAHENVREDAETLTISGLASNPSDPGSRWKDALKDLAASGFIEKDGQRNQITDAGRAHLGSLRSTAVVEI